MAPSTTDSLGSTTGRPSVGTNSRVTKSPAGSASNQITTPTTHQREVREPSRVSVTPPVWFDGRPDAGDGRPDAPDEAPTPSPTTRKRRDSAGRDDGTSRRAPLGSSDHQEGPIHTMNMTRHARRSVTALLGLGIVAITACADDDGAYQGGLPRRGQPDLPRDQPRTRAHRR